MSFGVGVYILAVIWFITLMLCWVSIRTGHNIGKISVPVSSVITLILLLVPKGEQNFTQAANFYDRLFVVRYAILTLLLVSVVIGSAFCFVYVCLAPVVTKKIKSFTNY